MAEEIITDLSKLRAIKVISRASAAKLKQAEDDLRALAGELDVHYVLEGSIRRAGDDLRVTAQLIDIAEDQHLWAEKYTGTMDDVFAIQEKLSRAIVDSLKVQLTGEEERELGERAIEDVRAFDCFLRARHEYERFTKDGIEKALRYADEGLEITGPNALLYVAKAHAHHRLSLIDSLRHHEHLEVCREWTEKSLEIEPDFVPGQALLGMVSYDLFETAEGLRRMERAYELDPNDLDNLGWLCWVYALSTLRHDETAELVARLLARDALGAFSHHTAGQCLWFANRLDDVEDHFEKAHRFDPSPQARVAYAQYLAAYGRTDEAIRLLAPLETAPLDHSWTIQGLTLKHALCGDGEAADALLTDEVLEAFSTDVLHAFMISERYALLGRRERALAWLATAIDAGVWNTDFLTSDPLLRTLTAEPEFDRQIARAREKLKQLDSE